MPWLILLLLPLAVAAVVLYRAGTAVRRVFILGILAGLAGAVLAVMLMGVV